MVTVTSPGLAGACPELPQIIIIMIALIEIIIMIIEGSIFRHESIDISSSRHVIDTVQIHSVMTMT